MSKYAPVKYTCADCGHEGEAGQPYKWPTAEGDIYLCPPCRYRRLDGLEPRQQRDPIALLEQVKADGWEVHVQTYKGQWLVGFDKGVHSYSPRVSAVAADTLPDAVRAALARLDSGRAGGE